MKEYRNEDLTTEKLGQLLRHGRPLLTVFLRFLFPDDKQIAASSGLDWEIETQHRISHGRIDLLIHTPSVALIIECKIDCGQAIHQLSKYHEFWTNHRRSRPLIFWLARRRGGEMGLNPFLTRELLWDDLHRHLISNRELLDLSARAKVDQFCAYLKSADILLASDEPTERRPRNRGYDFKFAEGLLKKVGQRLNGIDWEVVAPVNEVPHRLVLGRPEWRQKFADGWIKRVVLRFKPERSVEDGFTLSGAVLLYNRRPGVSLPFAISQFPRWAQVCHDAGMEISRKAGAKWRGGNKMILRPPFELTSPVANVIADSLIPEERLIVYTPPQIEHAVTEGRKVISGLLAIVDQF